jgi:hypothetical protein
MRPELAIWALGSAILLFLIWLDVPMWCFFSVALVLAAVDWSAKRWIFRRSPARTAPASQKESEAIEWITNRRLITGAIGGCLGVVVGVSVGMVMQSNATTIVWLAIILGTFGLLFGTVFKMTL